jgi:hypothetical protein
MCVVVGVDAGVLVGDVYGVVYLLRHLVLGVYVGMCGGEILMCWDRGRGKRGGRAGWHTHRRAERQDGAGWHTPGTTR